jgi:hypothetical protein
VAVQEPAAINFNGVKMSQPNKNTWNSLTDSANDAFNLPEGRYATSFGFLVEQSVEPDKVLEVVEELKAKSIDITAATQAGILVKAQKAGLLQDWAELELF